MKNRFLLFSFIFISNIISSQTFERSYFSGSSQCILQKEDSSFVLSTRGPVLFHIGPAGDSISVKTFPIDKIYNLIKSSEGGYILGGDDQSRACVIKLDSAMDTLWKKIFPPLYSSSEMNYVTDLVELDDSSIVFSTRGIGVTDSYTRAVIYRLDKNGNVIWNTTPPMTTRSWACNIAFDTAHLYSALFLYSAGIYSLQLTSQSILNGDTLWQKFYYDSVNHHGFQPSYLLRTDSNFYIAGGINYYPSINIFLNRQYSQMLMKFDLNGDSIWMHEYSDGQFFKINRNSASSFYCVGYEGDSAVLVKMDGYGNRLLTKYFIGNGQALFLDIIFTSDNELAISGSTIDPTDNYIYVVRTDSAGIVHTLIETLPDQLPVEYYFDIASKILHINFDHTENTDLIIYSMDGKLVTSKKLESSINQVELEWLNSGQYIAVLKKSSIVVSHFKFQVY